MKNLKRVLAQAKETLSATAKAIYTCVVKPVINANIAAAKAVGNACCVTAKHAAQEVAMATQNAALAVTLTAKNAYTKAYAVIKAAIPFCYVLLVFIVGTFAPMFTFVGIEWALQTTGVMAAYSAVYLFFSGEAFVFTATLTSLICGDKLCEKLCKREEHQRARAICQFVVFAVGVFYSCARYGLQTVGLSSSDIAMFAAHAAAFGVFRQWGTIWAKAKEVFATTAKTKRQGE